MTEIRLEKPADASQVRHVNEAAFGQPAEAGTSGVAMYREEFNE
jgi:predicted N-acetyltransferase YhbS